MPRRRRMTAEEVLALIKIWRSSRKKVDPKDFVKNKTVKRTLPTSARHGKELMSRKEKALLKAIRRREMLEREHKQNIKERIREIRRRQLRKVGRIIVKNLGRRKMDDFLKYFNPCMEDLGNKRLCRLLALSNLCRENPSHDLCGVSGVHKDPSKKYTDPNRPPLSKKQSPPGEDVRDEEKFGFEVISSFLNKPAVWLSLLRRRPKERLVEILAAMPGRKRTPKPVPGSYPNNINPDAKELWDETVRAFSEAIARKKKDEDKWRFAILLFEETSKKSGLQPFLFTGSLTDANFFFEAVEIVMKKIIPDNVKRIQLLLEDLGVKLDRTSISSGVKKLGTNSYVVSISLAIYLPLAYSTDMTLRSKITDILKDIKFSPEKPGIFIRKSPYRVSLWERVDFNERVYQVSMIFTLVQVDQFLSGFFGHKGESERETQLLLGKLLQEALNKAK